MRHRRLLLLLAMIACLLGPPSILAGVIIPPAPGGAAGPHAATHSPGQSDDISGVYATKEYADAIAQGLDPKASVVNATTANIALTGEQTIDGVLTSTSRILVKNQNTASQNGIYVTAAGAWARSTDADTSPEVTAGLFTFVEAGTTQAATGWVLATPNPIVLNTTDLLFTQFSGAGEATIAGTGMTKAGNTLNVIAGTGLTAAADSIGITALGVTAALIGNNEVALGTKTTGDYVDGVTSGGGLTKTGNEGADLGITPCGPGLIQKMNGAGTAYECAQDETSGLGMINVFAAPYNVVPNSAAAATTNTIAIQAAIDASQALGGFNDVGYPAIYFPPGAIYFNGTITQKSAPFICSWTRVGTTFFWTGDEATTAITKEGFVDGDKSWGGIHNCAFRATTGARPLHWLDLSDGDPVDIGYRLSEVGFNGSSGDSIVIGGAWNLNWDNLRFDACGEYCIRLTVHSGAFLQTFSITKFTWDNNDVFGGNDGGEGFLIIDNSTEADSTNIGTIILEKGRIEYNDDSDDGSLDVVTVIPNSISGNPGARKVVLRDIEVQDVLPVTGDALVRSVPASSMGVILENVDVSGVDALLVDVNNCDLTTHTASPHQGRLTWYSCGTSFVEYANAALRVRATAAGTETESGFQLFRGAETTARIHLTRDGRVSFGPGNAATDAFLFRAADSRIETGSSGTLDSFRAAGLLASTPVAFTCADSGNGSLGTLTLLPTSSVVNLTNSDADGCTVTMSESGALSGATVTIVVISNAGGTVNFADTAGVSELSGALTLAVTDTLTLIYTNSAWYQLTTSNN